MENVNAFQPLALEARDLVCSRGGRPVFSGLSFGVGPEQVLAVSGPNGAGKSSLLRIVAGLLQPDSGSVVLEGGADDEAVTHYLGHVDALKPALTLRETLRFWAILYQQGRLVLDADVSEAADAVGLGHAIDLHVGVLSAGQRRRTALARLLLSPRPLWLLDEPTAALDSEGEALLRRLMVDHTRRGGLIVAATHQALPVTPDAVLDLGAA
jgi:heme exporter protein A